MSVTPGGGDPWRRLMLAVVMQAGVEAREGDRDALMWLAGDDCEAYCFALDLDRERIHDMVDKWAGLRPSGRRLGRRSPPAGRIVVKIWEPGAAALAV